MTNSTMLSVPFKDVGVSERFSIGLDTYVKTNSGALKVTAPKDNANFTFDDGAEVFVSRQVTHKEIATMAGQQMVKLESAGAELDKVAAEGASLNCGVVKTFGQIVQMATLAQKISATLSPEVMAGIFMPMRNKSFGWRTDKDYPMEVYHDIWVGAILKGALPGNNEVLVIGGNAYLQKDFFRRKVHDMPGLTDLVLMPGKVESKVGGALVEMTATFNYNGKPMTVARVGASSMPVRLNNGQGADAALGKAERKILAAVYNRLTGSDVSDMEPDVDISDFTVESATIVETQAEAKSVNAATIGTENAKAALKKNKPVTPPKQEAVKEEVVDANTGEITQESEPAPDEKPAEQPKAEEKAPEAPKTDVKKKVVGHVREGIGGELKPVVKDETKAPVKTEAKKPDAKKADEAPVEGKAIRMTMFMQKQLGLVGDTPTKTVANVLKMGREPLKDKDGKATESFRVGMITDDQRKYCTYDVERGGLAHAIKDWMNAKKQVELEWLPNAAGEAVVVFASEYVAPPEQKVEEDEFGGLDEPLPDSNG